MYLYELWELVDLLEKSDSCPWRRDNKIRFTDSCYPDYTVFIEYKSSPGYRARRWNLRICQKGAKDRFYTEEDHGRTQLKYPDICGAFWQVTNTRGKCLMKALDNAELRLTQELSLLRFVLNKAIKQSETNNEIA